MPKIQLQNTTSQPFEFTEYHDPVCMRRGECKCAIQRTVNENGKSVAKRLPRSFRVNAQALSEPVDREVLYVAHIADLVKAGKLTVVPVLEATPVKES